MTMHKIGDTCEVDGVVYEAMPEVDENCSECAGRPIGDGGKGICLKLPGHCYNDKIIWVRKEQAK